MYFYQVQDQTGLEPETEVDTGPQRPEWTGKVLWWRKRRYSVASCDPKSETLWYVWWSTLWPLTHSHNAASSTRLRLVASPEDFIRQLSREISSNHSITWRQIRCDPKSDVKVLLKKMMWHTPAVIRLIFNMASKMENLLKLDITCDWLQHQEQ